MTGKFDIYRIDDSFGGTCDEHLPGDLKGCFALEVEYNEYDPCLIPSKLIVNTKWFFFQLK